MRTRSLKLRIATASVAIAGLLTAATGCVVSVAGARDSSLMAAFDTGNQVLSTPAPTGNVEAQNDPDKPSTWTVTETGIGPIQLGDDFIAEVNELPATWMNSHDRCSWMAYWAADDGSYLVSFQRSKGAMTGPIVSVSVKRLEGTRVAGPATEDGLQVGSVASGLAQRYLEGEQIEGAGGEDGYVRVDESALYYRVIDKKVSEVVVSSRDIPGGDVCS